MIKEKLNYLEKNLSLKHLGRDIIGFQLLLIVSIFISLLLTLAVINYAVGTSNPGEVVKSAEQNSGYIFWLFYILGNFIVIIFIRKAKREANKTKKEIITMFEAKEGQE